MKKEMYNEDLLFFRDSVKRFLKKEVIPFHELWENRGIVPKDIWTKAGKAGLLGMTISKEYGGLGLKDFKYSCVLIEEIAKAGTSGLSFALHNDVAIPYLEKYCNEEQKKRWFPKLISGEKITALAMTEPGGGSDLKNIKTTAEDKGEYFLVNGSKTFITNGILGNLIITAVKTSSKEGGKGISLICIEDGMEGFEKGKNLKKIGLKAQDTAELFFKNVKVPKKNILGIEGEGFKYMMENLSQERLVIAVGALGVVEEVLKYTTQYTLERMAFNQPIGKFQNSRFKLAEMKTEAEIGRVFIDDCIELLNKKKLSSVKAAMAKYWATDLQVKTVDQCLQLYGGYGYMMEYEIARAYIDSRVQTIYGGTNEIMKEIIGRSMGL